MMSEEDPVLEQAQLYYEKAVREEQAGHKDEAERLFAEAAIRYYQSSTYARGVSYEMRISRAEECRQRSQNVHAKTGGRSNADNEAPQQDSARRGKKYLERSLPKITFSDVVGLEGVKERIRTAMIYPRQRPELFEKYRLTPGAKILIYGPPGCGKTLIAMACAGTLKMPFYQADCAKLLSKWVGEPEKNIASLFAAVREESSAILFLDEIDALGASREIVDSSTFARRIVTQLLIEINNLGNNTLLLGGTNAPWVLDPALVRTGRLGTPIFIPPPDWDARHVLMVTSLKGRPVEGVLGTNEAHSLLGGLRDPNCGVCTLSDWTEGFSAADISEKGGLCDRAAMRALREEMENPSIKRVIRMDDFRFVLANGEVRPTILSWVNEAKRYTKKSDTTQIFPEMAEFINQYECKRRTDSDLTIGAK